MTAEEQLKVRYNKIYDFMSGARQYPPKTLKAKQVQRFQNELIKNDLVKMERAIKHKGDAVPFEKRFTKIGKK